MAVVSGQSQQTRGIASDLELTPTEATRITKLFVSFRGGDLSGARIEWFINNIPFTPSDPVSFKCADAAKGDSIQAKARMQDKEVVSNVVQIKNALPEVTRVGLLPEVFKPGDTFYVDVEGADVDGDTVTFQYAWTNNGQPAGAGKKIEGSLKRGDKIRVEITPFDGEEYGIPIVIERQISNMPPVIVEHNDLTFDGKTYTYQVKATDPDGDALTYSLDGASDGMTINPSNGLLHWTVPQEFIGVRGVSVSVQDGQGGVAKYDLKIAIKPPSK